MDTPPDIHIPEVKRVALFGGSWLMGALIETPEAWRGNWDISLFSSPRHLDQDIVNRDGETLRQVAAKSGVPVVSAEDINSCSQLKEFTAGSALGLAIGAAWEFTGETVALFNQHQ